MKLKISREFVDKIIFWKVNNFYDALQPFQYISWIFGFGFIDTDSIIGKKMRSLIWEHVFLVMWLVFFMVFQRINWADNYFLTMSSSPIVNVGRRGIILFGMNIAMLTLISSYLVRGKCTKLFKQILDVDREFESLGLKMDYKMQSFKINLYNFVTLCFTAILIMISMLLVDTCITLKLCIYMHLPLYAMNNLAVYFSNHFVIFVLAINFRYTILNENLSRFTKLNSTILLTDFKENKPSSVMRLARVHDLLTECIDDVNFCFCVQTMMALGGIFGFLVTTIFAIFRTFLFNDPRLIGATNSFTLWSIFYSYIIMSAITFSSMVMKNGRHTSTVVHRAINECSQHYIREDLRIFSLQLCHRYPVVSCGLFPFDWTLLFSIVSAVTTYLMILVQFDTSITTHSNSTTY